MSYTWYRNDISKWEKQKAPGRNKWKKEMYIESKIDKLASKTGGYSKQKYLGTRSDVSNEECIQASSDTEDECVESEDSDLWNLWIWISKIKRPS